MTLLPKNIPFFTFFFFIFTACALPQNSYALNNTIDKWQTRLPEENGFTQKSLQTAIEKIGAMDGVYGVIIVRNGYLTIDKYFREGTADLPHNLKSASKSILSALVGIAIDQGYLQLDQPISDFLPFIKEMQDHRKNKITVQHLLSMKSGLQSMSYQAYNSWIINDDWLSKLLQLPIVAEPGTKHQYSTGDSHILSAVLTAATGMSTKKFAEKYLFGPLNVEIKGWEIDPQGIYQGGNNFSLYPLDIAKFGQLYLDGGRSNGKQIVPLWWIKESTKVLQPNLHEIYGGYGYLWYTHPGGEDAFVAVGYGGQYIYVSPEHKTVIVIISTLHSKGKSWETNLFKSIQYGILASIKETPHSLSSMKGRSTKLSNGITTDTVNLRKSPNTKSAIINTIEPGTILEIVAKTNSWLQVKSHQQEGWLASEFVNIIEPQKMALANGSPLSKKKRPLSQGSSPFEESLQIRVDNQKNALEKLKISQQKIATLLDEYAEKQAESQYYSASQKKEQSALQQQINQLQESAIKVITRYNQTDKSLDTLLLANDQIISHQQAMSTGLVTLQKNDQQFARDQKVMQESNTALKKNTGDLQKKLANEILAVQNSASKTKTEATATTKKILVEQNIFKKDVQDAARISQKNAAEIAQLHLANNQYLKQQDEIDNKLLAIKNDLITKKSALQKMEEEKQNKLNQINSEIVTFKETVSEIKHDLNLLQKTAVNVNDKQHELLTNQIEKLKISQQKFSTLLDEYAEKQATFQNYSASQKKEQAALQQQISQLQESALKIITRHNQKDKSLDTLLLANDQIISHQQAISTGLATLQKNDQQLAQNQKVIQTLNTAVTKSIGDLQERLANEIAAVKTSVSKTQNKITATSEDLIKGHNLFKKEVQDVALISKNNKDNITQLQLSDKQYRMQQGKIHNVLYAIKDDLSTSKSASEKIAEELQTKLSQINSKIATFKKSVSEIRNDLTLLQQNTVTAHDKHFESLSDQIEMQYIALSSDLTSLQKKAQQVAQEQKSIEASTSSLKKGLDNLQEDLTREIAAVKTSVSKAQDEITATSEDLIKGQNLFKKEVQNVALVSRNNADNISQLQLSNKQYRMQQGKTENELYAIKDNLIANKLLSQSDIVDQQKKLSQITSELVTFKETVAEFKTALNIHQKSSVAADAKHFDILTNTKTVTATLRDEIEKEKITQNQLAAKIDALKISLISVISKNKKLEDNFLSYKNKEEIIATKVLYLENELKEQQRFSNTSRNTISAYESKLALVQKELLALQRIPRKTIFTQVAHKEKREKPEQKTKTAVTIQPEIGRAETIGPFLTSWRDAWSQQNVQEYLGHYSANFLPPKNRSLLQWKANRLRSLTKPKFIKITISDLQTKPIDQDNVKVVFRQSYKSNTYSDSVMKTLYLNWQGSDWEITQEKSN